jgi:hypothetical protein
MVVMRIVFSSRVEITMPGVVARAPRALAVGYAEQAASRQKPRVGSLHASPTARISVVTISTYLIEYFAVNETFASLRGSGCIVRQTGSAPQQTESPTLAHDR